MIFCRMRPMPVKNETVSGYRAQPLQPALYNGCAGNRVVIDFYRTADYKWLSIGRKECF